MDSENIYHFHQNQLIGSPPLLPPPSSSSSLPTSSSCHGLASSSSSHTCTPTPNVTLSASNSFNQSYSGVILNSNSPMIQQSAGLPWFNNCHHPAHEHFSKINLEFSSDSFPKLTEMLNSPPSNIDDHSDLTATSCYLKNNIEEKNSNDVSDDDDKLLLKTNDQFSAGDFYSSFGSAKPISGNFSQIYPSINISNLISQSSSETSSNMNNLQALDLLESARLFGGNFRQPSHDNNLGLYKKSLPFGFDHHLQQSSSRPSCSPKNKISHFTNSGGEIIITEATKRPSGLMQQPKAKQSASNKKTRLESSGASSCPPLKVRKEKLGDRIAALQQMIAPFGKTDTASVLMEAIGYIKFLENQVETLSVPYMKSSRRNKSSSRTMQESFARVSRTWNSTMNSTNSTMYRFDIKMHIPSTMVAEKNGDDEKPKRDLRSRGLCLVPLSCMSFITNDAGNEGIWPPPNFGGGGTF